MASKNDRRNRKPFRWFGLRDRAARLGRALSNIRISRKLILAFAVVVLAVLVMCGVLFSSMQKLTQADKNSIAASNLVDAVNQAQLDMLDQMASIRAFIITQDPQLLDKEKERHEKFDRDLARARELAAGQPQLLPMIDAMKSSHEGWQTDVAAPQMKFAADPATKDKAATLVKSSLSKLREKDVRGKAEVVFRAVRTWSTGEDANAEQAVNLFEITLLVGGLMAAALSAAMGWQLNRAIGRPVGAMTAVMNRLAAGDNTVVVPAIGRKDEVGQMASAVETFKTAALEKLRLEAEAIEARDVADRSRASSEAERAAAAGRQMHVVEAIAEGLERLSGGDLIFRLDDPFAAEYEKLRTDFNGAMDRLQETMTEVLGKAQALHSGTDEISTAADDLSRRTEQQAASLEQTAAALDEITATVRKTSDGAVQARQVVGGAKQDAEQSSQVVRQAVEAMSGIEKSSKEIGQIIGVIDEIAFQTNLLALNAGIEAARAGDAGRGFAVVAAEVRGLAQRSADSAKEIKALISASKRQVDQGVGLVGKTGVALDRILTQVAEINGIVGEIAASAREQATGLDQVNTAINQMDQVTQQNAAMVEQSTAASHALAQDTEELAALIGRFQVGQEVAAESWQARRPVDAAAAQVVPLRAVRHGAAAPKLAPAATEDEWAEF